MFRKVILTLFLMIIFNSSAMAKVIKFAQVADAHFRTNNEYRAQVLRETVKSINNEKGISFVVFTGDNIDTPNVSFLPEFLKIINKLNVPYYIVIGNHDVYKNNGLSKAHYLEIVKSHKWFYKYTKPNYIFKKNGYVFIVADGAKEVIPGSVGYYKEDTLNWIDKQLKKHKRSKAVILQHFPLVASKELSSHRVYNKEEYLEMLDKHDNVVSVVAGHLHINSEMMRNGVYHITSPSLLNDTPSYKIISISTTRGFSPMVYTELKEVEIK